MSKPHQSAGRDLLGPVVGLEHGDCSLAAEALNASVAEFMKNSWDTTETLPIIESPKETLTREVRIIQTRSRLFLDGFNSIGLVLIGYTPVEKDPPIKRPLSLLSRWKKEVPVENPLPQEPPILAAYFENSFLLPLLTFKQTNEAGVCGYVQIGNEPGHDTVYTAGSDDRTPSLALIEAARRMLVDKLSSSDIQEILGLTVSQMLKNWEQVSHFFEMSLSSKLHTFLSKDWSTLSQPHQDDNRNSLTFVDTQDKGERRKRVIAKDLLPWCNLEDGSRTRLTLVYSPERSEFELCAVTRGNVAISLATVNLKDGKLEQAKIDGQPPPIEKEKFIQILLGLLKKGIPEDETYTDNLDQLLETIKENLRNHKVNVPEGGEIGLQSYLNHPNIYSELPKSIKWIHHPDLKKIVSARKEVSDFCADILQKLGVIEQLAQARGETSAHYEYMLDRFNTLLGSHDKIELKGEMDKTHTGTTEIDLAVWVELERKGACYEIKIYSRSKSSSKESPACVQRVFNSTAPMPKVNDAEAINDILDEILL